MQYFQFAWVACFSALCLRMGLISGLVAPPLRFSVRCGFRRDALQCLLSVSICGETKASICAAFGEEACLSCYPLALPVSLVARLGG